MSHTEIYDKAKALDFDSLSWEVGEVKYASELRREIAALNDWHPRTKAAQKVLSNFLSLHSVNIKQVGSGKNTKKYERTE